ncbi:MAG: hypothetical protein CMM50_15610 [Rhodospirillaceae bacterium]|nr:hypothetical protein [Rhodospirillaceae bacterium]
MTTTDQEIPTAGSGSLVKRGLLMVAFGFAAYVALWGVFVLAALQLVFMLIDRQPNAQLKSFSRNLAAWLLDIVAFLTFGTDTRPFPFAPFPDRRSSPAT